MVYDDAMMTILHLQIEMRQFVLTLESLCWKFRFRLMIAGTLKQPSQHPTSEEVSCPEIYDTMAPKATSIDLSL